MKSEREYPYLNILNVLSALAVVFLHVNVCFWNYKGVEDISWWKSANIIESLFYFAVPVFFMITGATLLDFYKKYGVREYVIKRLNKTFIPYIVWSLVGMIFNVFVLKIIPFRDVDIRYIIKGLVENSFVGVYWFFTALFSVYFCIPLLAAVDQKRKNSIYMFIVILAGVVNILIPFCISIIPFEIRWDYCVFVCSGYMFYVLVGYIINNNEIDKKVRMVIYLFSILGLVTHILGTYFLSIDANTVIRTYKGYNNLPCVLYSIGVFVFVKSITIKLNAKLISLFEFLSRYTFGVYLIHIFVIRGFEKFFIIDNTNIIYRLVSPFIYFTICVTSSYFIKKIPLLKRIVP